MPVCYFRSRVGADSRCACENAEAKERGDASTYVVVPDAHPDPEYSGVLVWWVMEVSA